MANNEKTNGDASASVIKADGINFSYRSGDPILKNVSLEVHAGDFYGIIGPNGSGKTTLVEILLGMLEPDSGRVALWGKKPSAAIASGRVSYVSQRATHFDRNFPATVLEVVASGRAGKVHASGGSERQAALAALAEVSMEKFAGRKIGELSTGQEQRVLIARALASGPELMFFDEPTLGVDAATEAEFYDLLKYLNEKKKLTLVIVTHDLDIIGHKVNKLMCLHCSVKGSDEPGKLLEGEALQLAAERGIRLVSHEQNGTHHHDRHEHHS